MGIFIIKILIRIKLIQTTIYTKQNMTPYKHIKKESNFTTDHSEN